MSMSCNDNVVCCVLIHVIPLASVIVPAPTFVDPIAILTTPPLLDVMNSPDPRNDNTPFQLQHCCVMEPVNINCDPLPPNTIDCVPPYCNTNDDTFSIQPEHMDIVFE